jgi:hypothetical protein
VESGPVSVSAEPEVAGQPVLVRARE